LSKDRVYHKFVQIDLRKKTRAEKKGKERGIQATVAAGRWQMCSR
jgi:hypothetical protein